MLTWVRRALWEQVPRDQQDTLEALRRRQIVSVVCVLIGGGVLGYSLRIEPGSGAFYASTVVLAVVWALGALTSGRLHMGRQLSGSRPVLPALAIGVLLVVLFVVGGLAVRQIPPLADYVRSVLEYADQGSLPVLLVITVVNGIAEELFFRGAAYAAIPRRPVLWTTVLYFVATLATGNVMLAFAAILLGAVCGLERRASGGVLAPIITHIVWSGAMLFILPTIFN